MNVSDAQELLRELAPSASEVHSEVGMAGVMPHNYTFLKLVSTSDSGDYAVISTPGDGWFELGVAGGFVTGQTSDLTPDDDVREILEYYVRAALAYLDGRWSNEKSRAFKIPFVKLHADDDCLKLHLSIVDTFKQVFRFTRVGRDG
ncbi:hypothetical protein [Salinibacterium sp. SWN248]|uniref:hypothetical protein n=1 Tax=Salinibacterium sp. SWN248 TaxID=2792056 RepID=UPI0018CD4E21|nr:hypothetical protein [Salinibacterium sp. SWN248]MBH0024751.1 hypothetical protein [Salinibacterium sp. SWN248]